MDTSVLKSKVRKKLDQSLNIPFWQLANALKPLEIKKIEILKTDVWLTQKYIL